MAKKNDDTVYADDALALDATVLTLFDGTNPVWVRRAAIDAFNGIGSPGPGLPPVSWRIILRSGQAIIVNGTDAAKVALLAALE